MQEMKSLFPEAGKIPESADLPAPVEQTEYLINGEIRHWQGDFQPVYSPIFQSNEETHGRYIGKYPLMDREESMKALDAAVAAFDSGKGEWPSMTVEQRIHCMRNFVILMKDQRDLTIRLLMWEIGKNLKDSEKEFDRTLDYINDTIEALKNLDRDSSRFVITQQIIGQIRRAPLGVALCMGPFNYPLNETFTTLIPALIMGNTVIFKPPKLGVLLHAPLLKAFCEAFPKGVVNTVYGDGQKIIGPLMESGKIDVLAFIGTSRVADLLKKQHPQPHRLRCILGLDAKNPAIILPDADLDEAVKECVLGALSFNGQRCTALKIIFVHERIAASFLQKLSDEVEKLKIGMPWEEGVNITPLPENGKTEYLTGLIRDAENHGARIINPGGGRVNRSCFFPAILSNVTEEMRVYKEEQFGPVVPVVRFQDAEEPLQYVIRSNYGQQASIFGRDPEQIARLIDTLVNQVSRVNLNSQCQRGPDTFPFTGRKDSAEGTLSVSDALRVFSIRTLVAAKDTDSNKKIISDIIKEDRSSFLNTDFIF